MPSSHSDHRPPLDTGPAQGDNPPTKMGQFYPEDDVVAVVSDQQTGERALAALEENGIPRGNMDLIPPHVVLAASQTIEQNRGVFEKIASFFALEEGTYADEYVEEAQAGAHIVIVHADNEEVMKLIARVLREHGARRLRHYGSSVITAL